MTTITLPRATVEQALEALGSSQYPQPRQMAAITNLRAALAQKHDPVAHSGWVLREVLFDNGEPIGHREPQHSPAALAQQAEPVEPVQPGAWVASPDGRVIYDDVSTDDGLLRVSGDFENDEQRLRYAQRIVDALNAAPPRCPNCASLEAQNAELDRKLAEMERAEPVAWRYKPMIGSPWSLSDDGYYISCKRDKGYTVEPLYTAPPQRTMVPLTEEETK